ncbi:MAG: cytidine deaminase [Bacteroidales bacterium]|jgi:cytidine deaminase|nr:cytidine deaminase [Bacteroidales bacterium]MCB9027525.1 cytidine deaminase [Bacteroidales bacterium]NLD62915.1 cytidine deaminase [Bacteroidales bacterium]HNT92925.1 cytidine deaminase [Bacteroidales bacterium]HOO66876.1 cytidine deaminase [Bacteroidales bacterium]
MNKREVNISFTEYQKSDELPDADKKLVAEAVDAASGAYAPYSGFRVGAAIMLDDGTVVRGANVENAAFPSGSCAEKTALSYMVANYGERQAVAIAITALSDGQMTEEPVPPCGNCRQMLIEEEQRGGKPIRVILAGHSATYVLESSQALMPLSFTGNNLRK